jgi:predicted nucleic acid-binding Zn ribbon protein
VVASQQLVCIVCGRARDPRKRETCSAQCRAALHRRRHEAARRAGLLALRDGLRLLRAQLDDRLAEVDALLALTRGRE